VETLEARIRDRGREDLQNDLGLRDLTDDGKIRDLRTDPGMQDLIRDLGEREARRLGVDWLERLPPGTGAARELSRAGGFPATSSDAENTSDEPKGNRGESRES